MTAPLPSSRPSAAGETWLILGASAALARPFARIAAAEGARLLLAGRDRADLEAIAADLSVRYDAAVGVRAFDALDRDGHAALAAEAGAQPKLNVLLAFAAMPPQAALDADPDRAARMLDLNLSGAASILLHLAPHLEAQRGGRLAIVGSVAGERGRRQNYVYGAAKAGLHALASGLRGRLRTAGVSTTLVKPGPFESRMTFARKTFGPPVSAEAVALACWRAARRRRAVVYVPWWWRPLTAIVRGLPEAVFQRLKV